MVRDLFLLRGIPGIGKSYWVSENGFEDYTISSDALRLNYPMTTTPDGRKVITQLYDTQVWKELYDILEKRMLRGDKVIIIDATHNQLKYLTKYEMMSYKYGYNIKVVNFDIDIDLAKEQNATREGYKYVPESVIETMAKRIKDSNAELNNRYSVLNPDVAKNQIKAVLGQGKIKINEMINDVIFSGGKPVKVLCNYIPAANLLLNFDQRNRWHHLNLEDHVTEVYKELKDNYLLEVRIKEGKITRRQFDLLLLTALVHDIGKPWAAKEDVSGSKELHYMGHAEIGAEIWKSCIANRLDITQEESDFVRNLILRHDLGVEELKGDFFGLMLRKADTLAHRNPSKEEVIKIDKYLMEC